MADSLLIGLTSLQAQRRAMEVTSHNISNAVTPGYSRQRADLTTETPEVDAKGMIGRGVDVAGIKRIADTLINERLRQAHGESGRLTQMAENLKTIELIFNEPGENGLAAVTDKLFSTFQDLANNPESAALRSTAVQQISTYATSVADLGSKLEQLKDDLRTAVENEIEQVNDLTSQIADLNQQIRRQSVTGGSPNDLLDQRDKLLNELSEHLDINIRTGQVGNAVLVDSGGVLLVGLESSNDLAVSTPGQGDLAVLAPGGGAITPPGGALAAFYELNTSILPAVIASLDEYALTVAKRLNAIQSTGTSQSFSAQGFTAQNLIPSTVVTQDLDSDAVIQSQSGMDGIPSIYRPDFTDANGTVVARNLTINVLDTASGVAQKYIVRYDPATGTGGRSLQDLVHAINGGSGGGFTVYPADQGIGVAGVDAKMVFVNGSYQFQLTSASGKSIDFSPALDTSPSAEAWAGQPVAVNAAGLALPATAAAQLQFTVESNGAGGYRLRARSRDQDTGALTDLGTLALNGGVANLAALGGNIQITSNHAAGSTYRIGDTFSVAVAGGAAVGGPAANEWGSTDAGVKVTGRYTGSLSFTPAMQWSMRVVTSGQVGAKVSSDPLDPTPAEVEFTYWTGEATAPQQLTVRRKLDSSYQAGSPVPIADGVYAVFGSGRLTAVAGQQLDFIVDAESDQAGILTGLGVNQLLSGDSAATMAVSSTLLANPDQLAVATSRSEGDNTNLLRMAGVRDERLFSNGSFTLDDQYQGIVSSIGVQINQADRMKENQEVIRSSLQARRDQTSGVNIDEEVSLLILQQQAYTAAARVITTARDNIQTLLELVR